MIKKLIASASWACWAAWLLPFKHSLVCPASAADTFLSLGTDGSSATLLTTHLALQQLAPQMIKILWRSTLIFPKTFFDFFFLIADTYFFTTKGFSFMPSTWKVLLSEWGTDWVKYLQFLLHCGTPVAEVSQASRLVCEIIVREIMEQDQQCSVPEFWQVYSYSQNMTFTEKWHPFVQHMFGLSAYSLQVSLKEM